MARRITPAIRRERYLTNRVKQLVWSLNARAKSYGVPGEVTTEIYEQITSQPCVYCGYDKYIELDHRIPMSKGGSNEIENLQGVCRYCNRSKHHYGEDEFLEWLNRFNKKAG